MPKELPGEAPADESAVVPVEEPTPDEVGEVSDGSPASQTVDAKRFNGLMAQYQRSLTEIQSLKSQIDNLKEKPVSEDSNLSNEVAELRSLIMEERLENARLKAVKDFPEIAPFADLIVADTPSGVRDMAKMLSDRMKGVKPAEAPPVTQEAPKVETPATPATTPPPVEAPVTAPGQSAAPEVNASDRVQAALAKGKGGFSEYLQAKWDLAAESGELEGLELAS